MKKLIKSLSAAALCLVLMFSLAACSSMGAITTAFEKEGFTHTADMDSSIKAAMEKFFEDNGISVTTHLFTKGTVVSTSTFMVFEFKSTPDLEKTLQDNETVKGLLKDLQKSDYVKDNCLLVPIVCISPSTAKVIEIFKNA